MPEAPMDFDELIQYVEELTKTSPPTEPETPTETPA
jgi:hypothetical protein